MRKALFAIALGIIVVLTFQACGPGSDFAKSQKIIGAAVATPPLGYVAGEVEGGNWLSTAGNQQNFQVWFQKSLTTESVDSECSYIIDWATTFGANQFWDGQAQKADGNITQIMLSGNEAQAQQACVEVLSLGMDPGIESGSGVWQMFGTYQSDGTPLGDFYIDFNHSYDQDAGKTDLTHSMNMVFFTLLGVAP
jgi:hypothetical protein